MGTQYNGLSGNVNTWSTLSVTAASNAPPIVITTATHGLTTGDIVDVAGVGGNTAANGRWTVTVVSPTTFSLNGSAGNGAYTSGGVVFRRTLNPSTFTVPSDGDAQNAASVDVALEALGDRTAYLEKYVGNGSYFLVDSTGGGVDTALPIGSGTATTITLTNTWYASGLTFASPSWQVQRGGSPITIDFVVTDVMIVVAGSGAATDHQYASLRSSYNGGTSYNVAAVTGAEAVWDGTGITTLNLKAFEFIPSNTVGSSSYQTQLFFASLHASGQTSYYGYTYVMNWYRHV